MTDARGASATYSYNNRHLVTGITYYAPTGITATPNVAFAYDAAGNWTSMTDGAGSCTYNFDQLSRMSSETHTFNGLAGSFTLGYGYNLAGELTSITDPWSGTINYGIDSSGRLNNINGSGYGTVTQFDSNMQYRAWGTLKSETFGNGLTQSATYNNRMQMTAFEVRKASTELHMSTTTQFYADGQVKFAHNALDERFDRTFAYDNLARPIEAYSGSEARDFVNNTNSGNPTGPYRQSYQFNAFSNITQQTNRLWSANETTTNIYVNNRMQGWSYDAAGFVTAADEVSFTRDAAGRTVRTDHESTHAIYSFDGVGRITKKAFTRPGLHGTPITTTTYYLNSSVLGGLVLAELNASGQKTKRNVYAGRRKLAEELGGEIAWSHAEPVTGSRGQSNAGGAYYPQAEFNADGIDVGFASPVETAPEMPDTDWGVLGLDSGCSIADPNCTTCILDGFETDCGHVMQLAAAGALQIQVQNARGDRRYVDVDVMLGVLYVPGRHEHGHYQTTGGWEYDPDDLTTAPTWNPTLEVFHTEINYFQAAWIPIAQDVLSENITELFRRVRETMSSGIENILNKFNLSGLSFSIIACQAAQESGFDVNARNSKSDPDDLGLMQIQLPTAQDQLNKISSSKPAPTLSEKDLFDPSVNVALATSHLGALNNTFGSVRTALGAYKQGIGNTRNGQRYFGQKDVPPGTRRYAVDASGLSVYSQFYADSILGCAALVDLARHSPVP